jgi:hypothetical protein
MDGGDEQRDAITFCLTLNVLTTTIVAPPSNASKWQMGFNSAFKGLKAGLYSRETQVLVQRA